MNDDFVTYELADKLKEKGYREKCRKHYYPNSEDWFISSVPECDNFSSYTDAPTISQVLKWLREEKLILIGLSPMQEYDGDETIEWCSTVYKADKQGGLSWQEEFYYQSYEQAALAGIEYVLDNLI